MGNQSNSEDELIRWRRRRARKRLVKDLLRLPLEWPAIGLCILVMPMMSRCLLFRICDIIAGAYYCFDFVGRRYALANLRRVRRGLPGCGVGKPTRAEKLIIRRSYRNMTRTIGHAFWTSRNPIGKVRVAGELSPLAREKILANHPSVAVSGHIGCWEILSQLVFLEGCRTMSVAKRIGTTHMTRLLMKARESIGQEIVASDGALVHLISGIKEGKTLGLLVDQYVSRRKGGIWVRFLGEPMCVSAAPALLAAKAKVNLLVVWSRPLPGGRYSCEFVEEISSDEARDIWRTTQRCTLAIERIIRRHPSCWVLNYNYFKRKVPDEVIRELERRERNAF